MIAVLATDYPWTTTWGFISCLAQVDGLQPTMDEIVTIADGRVLAVGSESGTVKVTGRRFDAGCAHLWTLDGGMATSLRGFIDTAAVARAFVTH